MSAKETDMAAVLELLIDKIGAIQAGGGTSISADQIERLIEKAGASADALRDKLIPENKVVPLISAYAPHGEAHKKEHHRLKRETHFCGYFQREDNLTPEEIDAFNAIDQDCDAHNGAWRARIVRKGLKEALFIECDEQVERDRARDLPPLLNMLVELKNGPAAVDLAYLMRQVTEMQTKLAAVGANA